MIDNLYRQRTRADSQPGQLYRLSHHIHDSSNGWMRIIIMLRYPQHSGTVRFNACVKVAATTGAA